MQAAYRRTGDMDGLLNQLFYVSKIETGNMPLSVQKIEIADFIRNYVNGKQELLDKEKEQMQAETGDIHLDVDADPEQLQRIFDNLLENSRKYAERDVLKTELSLKRTEGGVEICFRDNGVGVPEEKLPYVFDEFYRGDESRNKKEGNGLGLYTEVKFPMCWRIFILVILPVSRLRLHRIPMELAIQKNLRICLQE